MILGVVQMPSGALVTLTKIGAYYQTKVYVRDQDSTRNLTTADAREWLKMMRGLPMDGAFWPSGTGGGR